jgi:hypothetical protein
MSKRFAFRATAIIALLTMAGVAHAQPAALSSSSTTQSSPAAPSDDPIALYRVYEAALARGDTKAMSEAAVLAWQTGERVWKGNNPNLAGLAFNAAWSLTLANRFAEVPEPARRALALIAQKPGTADPKEAAFLLAYADMMVTNSKANVQTFNVAAKAVENVGWNDLLLSRAYLDGARTALDVDLPRVTRELVDRGLIEVARVAPNNETIRTALLILRTQSSLELREYAQAVDEVMQARRSYGVPRAERDLNWSNLAAWEAASRAIYQSAPSSSPATGSRLRGSRKMLQWTKEEKAALSGRPKECQDIDPALNRRTSRTGIEFPARELRDRYVGGAYIRAHLDSAGEVVTAEILAALPRPAFGTAAQEGIQKWRYNLPANIPPQCRVVDVVVMYVF